MDNSIGIFDSGVGGLTVFSEIRKSLPHENLIYVGDTERFPYGNKSKENIIQFAKQITEFLIEKKVKMIVIACGTATSQALKELREIYKIPIFGIIEPTIQNQIDSSIKKVGIIATKGTIRSNAWIDAIKAKNENIITISKECPLLAPMAEEGWVDNEVAKFTIREYMKVFKGEDIQKLILGCTHYPLFKKLIQEELGSNVKLVNTGEEIAKFLEVYLEENNIKNNDSKIGKEKIYLTDVECNFINVASILLNRKVKVEKLMLN